MALEPLQSLVAVLVGAVVLALAAWIVPAWRARRPRVAAAARAETLRLAGLAVVRAVVAERLTAPTTAVLDGHREVRTAMLDAVRS